ncbi:MAG: 3-phosphoshikimate 1-carboxyvinyltransferase [Phycisphaerae bacterium]|nr:3-phosphoshikimate 1-carboxyvinyltransferase [Phycisphaerae bacterium]
MRDSLPIEPLALLEQRSSPFDVALRVPGSKSLTNRLYVLAALASGTSRIRGALASDDTDRLLTALETLGVGVSREGDDVLITGGAGRLPRGGSVNLGDGGTPTRFMLALATLARGSVVIDGSERMRQRPVDEGVALLRRLGATIEATIIDGIERLPVTVRLSAMRGRTLVVGQTASSQFISALLLIAPCLGTALMLRYREPPTSSSYLDLTVEAMQMFGITVGGERDARGGLSGHEVTPQVISARDVSVEVDASSAVYFAVAAAIVPGARVELLGKVPASRQPDWRLLDVLAAMGATVESRGDGATTSVVVRGPERLRAMKVNATLFPDASMALAIACACAAGTSVITGLKTLRVKETDRVAALAAELTKVGCEVVATDDSLRITPPAPRTDRVTIETYGDHRMAMSFAVLGLVRPGIEIVDPGCVAKSYPGFWSDFARLRQATATLENTS